MTNLTTINSSTEIFNTVVEMTMEITHADESQFYLANDSVQKPFKVASASLKENIFEIKSGIENTKE